MSVLHSRSAKKGEAKSDAIRKKIQDDQSSHEPAPCALRASAEDFSGRPRSL